jgi:hypothetical protein
MKLLIAEDMEIKQIGLFTFTTVERHLKRIEILCLLDNRLYYAFTEVFEEVTLKAFADFYVGILNRQNQVHGLRSTRFLDVVHRLIF